ncbi:hypothetical protein CP356_08200 [Lactobacillus sp. UMNPBX5]|nr:hypothetical protein CP356_08200 [Lactobacillus sp. UMNPBX5]
MLTCITIAIVLAIYFIIGFINYAEKRIFNRLYSDLFDRIKHYMIIIWSSIIIFLFSSRL